MKSITLYLLANGSVRAGHSLPKRQELSMVYHTPSSDLIHYFYQQGSKIFQQVLDTLEEWIRLLIRGEVLHIRKCRKLCRGFADKCSELAGYLFEAAKTFVRQMKKLVA